MRLIEVESGKQVRVVAIVGGYGVAHKLRQLGLLPGDCVRVLQQAPFGGPMLIEVNGRKVAIGRGVASKIEVEETACVSL
jgi:ferrous iron transport protein A